MDRTIGAMDLTFDIMHELGMMDMTNDELIKLAVTVYPIVQRTAERVAQATAIHMQQAQFLSSIPIEMCARC